MSTIVLNAPSGNEPEPTLHKNTRYSDNSLVSNPTNESGTGMAGPGAEATVPGEKVDNISLPEMNDV